MMGGKKNDKSKHNFYQVINKKKSFKKHTDNCFKSAL